MKKYASNFSDKKNLKYIIRIIRIRFDHSNYLSDLSDLNIARTTATSFNVLIIVSYWSRKNVGDLSDFSYKKSLKANLHRIICHNVSLKPSIVYFAG